jgi:hypothetical protein
MRKLILGFALAWGLFSLLRETGHALAEMDAREQNREAVPYWRLGTPQVEELDRCLALVRQRVPPGRVVVFASPPDETPGDQSEFFRWRWAAYLLPAHEVAPLQGPDTGRLAEYLVTYQHDFENPRLQPMAQLPEIPGCHLYKVRKATP